MKFPHLSIITAMSFALAAAPMEGVLETAPGRKRGRRELDRRSELF
jgi:hypothetical protein